MILRSLAVSLGKNESGDLSFPFSLNPDSPLACFLLAFKVAHQSPLVRKITLPLEGAVSHWSARHGVLEMAEDPLEAFLSI